MLTQVDEDFTKTVETHGDLTNKYGGLATPPAKPTIDG